MHKPFAGVLFSFLSKHRTVYAYINRRTFFGLTIPLLMLAQLTLSLFYLVYSCLCPFIIVFFLLYINYFFVTNFKGYSL